MSNSLYITEIEANLIRQWYNSVRDTNPLFLEFSDAELYIKLMAFLGMRVSPSDIEPLTASGYDAATDTHRKHEIAAIVPGVDPSNVRIRLTRDGSEEIVTFKRPAALQHIQTVISVNFPN